MDEINMKGDPALLGKALPDGKVVMSNKEYSALFDNMRGVTKKYMRLSYADGRLIYRHGGGH